MSDLDPAARPPLPSPPITTTETRSNTSYLSTVATLRLPWTSPLRNDSETEPVFEGAAAVSLPGRFLSGAFSLSYPPPLARWTRDDTTQRFFAESIQ
jgi:hypothetical protein